ncbi:MAG: SDR family NAD(P)-dependent oxidoreductase [Deltaproteobacteria bacterium]|nr:SDR family NAD(P)-dependent oxidoreductase [Deltaproteobacteria bacterium]
MYSLEGHSAVVTGGASGIGLATVRLLAEAGANVVIADINEEAGVQVVEELTEKGAGALFVRTDVTRGEDVDALISATTARFGSLEIAMPFAGIGLEKLALETTREEWERMLAVNLTGSFLVMQAAGSVMVEAGYGRIVAMASVSGMRGGTGRVAYGATKGAMITMTRVMALELAETGVTVNALAPGPVDTALTRKMYDDETRRAYDRAIPMRRFALPEEVAHAALFLALPQSGYITGITLPVDGGFTSSGVIKRS